MSARGVVVTAFTVEVCCPACGEPVPSTDGGSHFWTLEELTRREDETLSCNACEEDLIVRRPKRVEIGGAH